MTSNSSWTSSDIFSSRLLKKKTLRLRQEKNEGQMALSPITKEEEKRDDGLGKKEIFLQNNEWNRKGGGES